MEPTGSKRKKPEEITIDIENNKSNENVSKKGVLKCVENFCYFAKESLPSIIGYSQGAVTQLATGNLPTSLLGITNLMAQKAIFKSDVQVISYLIGDMEEFIKNAKRFKYPLCNLTTLENKLKEISTRIKDYQTKGDTVFNASKKEFFTSAWSEWYRDQLSKDIALMQSIISNIQTNILNILLLFQLKQNSIDSNEKVIIENVIQSVLTCTKE